MTKVEAKALAVIEGTSDEDIYGPHGGFTAVLSTPSLDRDGDRLERPDWIEPFQDRYPLDMDHGMSVADTIGSYEPFWEDDKLKMRAYFASTTKAQEARTLVKEGHIRSVSVAFMTDKSKKSGEPRREMLNAGLVAVPSNRDAIIEDFKASPKPYGDVTYADPEEGKYPIDTVAHIRAALAYIGMPKNRAVLGSHLAHVEAAIHAAARAHGINVAEDRGKSVDEADAKASPNAGGANHASGMGGDRALLQAAHDALVHLGAVCFPLVSPDEDPTGTSDGANKSVDDPEAGHVETKDVGSPEELVPEGWTMEQFQTALTHILNPPVSPAESPAQDDAPSETEPASEAPDDAPENVDPRQEGERMLTELFAYVQ